MKKKKKKTDEDKTNNKTKTETKTKTRPTKTKTREDTAMNQDTRQWQDKTWQGKTRRDNRDEVIERTERTTGTG